MLNVLERYYARAGNGGSGEYAFMRQVRNAAGFDAKRTFDAVIVGLWPSRGHDIHVIEVKVSRSDWLRELKDPKKAEDASKVADRFSVAAPRGVVDVAELPATWGYIEVQGGVEEFEEIPPMFPGDEPHKLRKVTGRKVRVARAAPLLRSAEECRGPIPRTFLVPMLRAAGAVPPTVPNHQVIIDNAAAAAVDKARQEWRSAEAERAADARARGEELTQFKRRAGLYWHDEVSMLEQATKVRTLIRASDSPVRVLDSLRHLQGELGRVVKELTDSLTAETGDES